MKPRLLLLYFALILLYQSCSSGKSAYKHGEYYEAVMEAVKRLRQSPDHKKSKEVLYLSYEPAVKALEADAQTQIASNANLKWKSVVDDYNKINALGDAITHCPGASKIIEHPVNKNNELKVAKDSAASECYNRGMESMLKNTREDAKQAFFLFTDANNFSPGYRESIEMLTQAKFNATLKVVVTPTFQNYTSWNFDPIVYGIKVNQFVQFYTQEQIQAENITKVDHYLQVSVNGFQEGRPNISKNPTNYQDSVTLGNKTVNGKSVPNRQLVTAQVVMYEKTMDANGTIQLFIRDPDNKQLMNTTLTTRPVWTDKWAYCSGDNRAIPKGISSFCGKSETYPPGGHLQNLAKKDLDNQLASTLNGYYKNF